MSASSEQPERRCASVPSRVPRTVLRHNSFVAEIIEDRRIAPVVHCVIQREGSSEVFFYGQFQSCQQAEKAALAEMRELVRRQEKTGTT